MRIIFVRHGEPDYANDCLTPEGHKQAAAAAERLSVEGVREIYAAPSGRAQQTAACTARRLGLEVATLSFMGEISWGGPGIPADGRPWTLGYRMLQEGFDFNAVDWRRHPYFAENTVTRYYSTVTDKFDEFLRDIDYLTEAGQAKTYGSIGRRPNIKALEELQNRKPYSAIPILTDESDQRILVGRE